VINALVRYFKSNQSNFIEAIEIFVSFCRHFLFNEIRNAIALVEILQSSTSGSQLSYQLKIFPAAYVLLLKL